MIKSLRDDYKIDHENWYLFINNKRPGVDDSKINNYIKIKRSSFLSFEDPYTIQKFIEKIRSDFAKNKYINNLINAIYEYKNIVLKYYYIYLWYNSKLSSLRNGAIDSYNQSVKCAIDVVKDIRNLQSLGRTLESKTLLDTLFPAGGTIAINTKSTSDPFKGLCDIVSGHNNIPHNAKLNLQKIVEILKNNMGKIEANCHPDSWPWIECKIFENENKYNEMNGFTKLFNDLHPLVGKINEETKIITGHVDGNMEYRYEDSKLYKKITNYAYTKAMEMLVQNTTGGADESPNDLRNNISSIISIIILIVILLAIILLIYIILVETGIVEWKNTTQKYDTKII